MKQTAMQQLLAQLKDERINLPMEIEWDRCYQAIEMVIENNYLQMEKEERIKDYARGLEDGYYFEGSRSDWEAEGCQKYMAEQYYNETYNK